jgi:hypothetical protein
LATGYFDGKDQVSERVENQEWKANKLAQRQYNDLIVMENRVLRVATGEFQDRSLGNLEFCAGRTPRWGTGPRVKPNHNARAGDTFLKRLRASDSPADAAN